MFFTIYPKRYLCEVIGVLLSVIVGIISHFIHIFGHHLVHLKLTQFL